MSPECMSGYLFVFGIGRTADRSINGEISSIGPQQPEFRMSL